MVACRALAVEPELSGLSALARQLKMVGVRRPPERELMRFAELVDRIGMAAADVALIGLLDACGLFSEALQRLTRTSHLPNEALDGLQEWVHLVEQYAQKPGDEATCAAMIGHLRRPCWRISMCDADAQNLLDMLRMTPRTPPLTANFSRTFVSLDELAELDDDPRPAQELAQGEWLTDDDALSVTLTEEIVPAAATDELDVPPESVALAVAPAKIAPAIQEALTVLIDELPQVSVAFAPLVGLARAPQVEADVFTNALELAAEMLTRLGSTTESLGLNGLTEVCRHLRSNLLPATNQTKSQVANAGDTWSAVVPAVREYLKSPYDPTRASALAALLTDAHLAIPLNAMGAVALTRTLANPDFSALDLEGSSRPQTASPEDVSLVLPEDANPELVDALLHELPQQTEELSAAVQRLLRADGSLEDVAVAQRIAHTIKGGGNTVGVRGIAELTHQLEDILIALARHETLPSPELAQTLITASDCLQSMAEALQGTGPAPTDSVTVLQEVLDWANRIDREGPPIAESAFRTAGPQPSASPVSTGTIPTPEREVAVPMLRVPSTLIDDLLRLVGEAMIQNSQLHERARSTRQEARTMIRQFDLLQQIGTELEELIDLQDLSLTHQSRAHERGFDALELDQYNELHTHSRRLIEAAVDAREIGRSVIDNLGELNDLLVAQERLNRDTQEGVLRTRMVPVKSVFPRFERSVRQTCRLTGKSVELHLSGGETQMDSDVLNQIVDPLMHVLRNAVDHGIENPHARQGAGKDPTGHITLEFLRDGKNILVRCRDDGAGLDFKAIRDVAEHRGLLRPGSEVSDDVLKNFVLLPNFTTRRSATQTSGRGIGLDAVHSSVAALGGLLTLHSMEGRGCVVEVRLPVSLLSSNALLVRTDEQTIAIASRGIEQIRHVQDGEVRPSGDELVFHTGEQAIPACTLESAMNGVPAPDGALDAYRAVLVVRSERGEHAILVKSVMASRDLVVKTLGRYIPKLRGIVGATILGDGSVTPVIDLAELLRAPIATAVDRTSAISHSPTPQIRSRRALVVDDSLSARKAMAQVLVDAGFEVTTARDGMEAVDTLEHLLPDIMFVDLEMPRMNGIELTSHVRARVDMSHVPIVMITSRSTEKHRTQARVAGVNVYLTKPFDADALLEQTERLVDNQQCHFPKR